MDHQARVRAGEGERSCLRGDDTSRVFQARDLLVGELATAWTVPLLCARVGLNSKKLRLGFRDVFGTSPHAFLHEARMQAAEKLLRCHDRNVDQVGYAVGFSSPSHFSQAFSRRFDTSPSDYRRQFDVARESGAR
jgi:AraC family transcriptional activator of pyochelin receptor